MAAMKKHTRKGFTLMELIIVIALFSVIMYSIVQLMDPVSKYFVRSSNFENTNACVDNMKRCIEGNLKFADRVRVYSGYRPYHYNTVTEGGITTQVSPYASTTNLAYPVGSLEENVTGFYNEFFKNRKYLKSHGTIYVLIFDNTELIDDTNLAKLGVYSQFTDQKLNAGKIVRYEYSFDNYNGNLDLAHPHTTVWYVNQKMYSNFEYRFTLGAFDPSEIVAGASFNPEDTTISITMRELRKDKDVGGLVRESTMRTETASFSMKNVLDAAQRYASPLADYITVENATYTDILKKYRTLKNVDYNPSLAGSPSADLPHPIPRYAALNTNPTSDFDGFYFIYTLPDNVYDDIERDTAYRDAVAAKISAPVTS